ncbi:hypothetical protein ACJRPK_11525 [Aquimarina sp. 2-A2]|uniref:hypothetical protein n=1 Tax=Aquimarina sp. 2-A2 TaxID=3382644 RepID=UPI00387EE8CA
MTNNLVFHPNTVYLFFLIVALSNCKKSKDFETTIEYAQSNSSQEQNNKSLPSLIGKWQLDSVIFIDHAIRSEAQIPFTNTSWIFNEKGVYTVSSKQRQLEMSSLQDNVKQKTYLTAEIPKRELNGRFRQNENELLTSILGVKTKYLIVKQSDTTLQLKSQRWQTPPISEKEKEQLAEHYFTFLQ